jgi:hypothetical protein
MREKLEAQKAKRRRQRMAAAETGGGKFKDDSSLPARRSALDRFRTG